MSRYTPTWKPCACGCQAPTTTKYVAGHRPNSYYTPKWKLCACGCGTQTTKKFAPQHRAVLEAPKPKTPKPCACGCGELVMTKWVPAHLSLDKVRRWKRKNRDKVQAQRTRARAREHGLKVDELKLLEWVSKSLLDYWTKSYIRQIAVRRKLLGVVWFNVTNWIRKSIRLYPSTQVRRVWNNVTAWTKCLAWNVRYTPDPDNNAMWIIYGLVDPRTLEIRYVGQTQQGLNRPKQHRNRGGGYNGYKVGWIKSLQKCGLTFNIVVLEVTKSNKEALNEAEAWWIAYGRLSGWRLTNLTDGGDGCYGRPISPETRAKISLARKVGGPVTPEGIKKKMRVRNIKNFK